MTEDPAHLEISLWEEEGPEISPPHASALELPGAIPELDGLNPRQQRFVVTYVKTGNGAQAARAAGYSDPKVTAYRLLRRTPKVRNAVIAMLGQDPLIADAEEVLGFFSATMRGIMPRETEEGGREISPDLQLKAAENLAKFHGIAGHKPEETATDTEGAMERALKAFATIAAKAEPPAPEIETEAEIPDASASD